MRNIDENRPFVIPSDADKSLLSERDDQIVRRFASLKTTCWTSFPGLCELLLQLESAQ